MNQKLINNNKHTGNGPIYGLPIGEFYGVYTPTNTTWWWGLYPNLSDYRLLQLDLDPPYLHLHPTYSQKMSNVDTQ